MQIIAPPCVHALASPSRAPCQVKPPRVRESAVQMECKVRHTYEVKNAAGAVSTTVVLAEVVLMHVADGVAGALGDGWLECSGKCGWR